MLRTISSKCFQLLSLCKTCRSFGSQKCCYGSALYVTGDKAKDTFSVVNPYLDFATWFSNMDDLTTNIKLRNLKLDAQKLKELWEYRKSIVETKVKLEERQNELTEMIKTLLRSGDEESTKNDIEQMKLSSRMIKDDLKALTKSLWSLDEKVVIESLLLPNKLHPDTPSEAEVVCEFKQKSASTQTESHVAIGQKQKLLEASLYSPSFFYLKGKSALWELNIANNLAKFLRAANFLQVSNPDFARSVVVEGCRFLHRDPLSTFLIGTTDEAEVINKDGRLHLVGSSSLIPFCAFFTKQSVKSLLPIKLFNVGRKYIPRHFNNKDLDAERYGLFGSAQGTCIDVFIACESGFDAMMQEYDNILALITNFYKQMNYHFRVVKVPPAELLPSESFKASIQMFSCFSQIYVEVGNVSIYDDYISKRLIMCYDVGSNKPREFLKIVSGTFLSVPHVLGCLLEMPVCPLTVDEQLK